MSVFDGKRLPPEVFKLDVERMRHGWYSDKYFDNIVRVLADLAAQGYRFGGTNPDLSDLHVDLANVDIGNIEVEMQWFTRREPFSVVVGVDKALAMLKLCTGYFDDAGAFVSTWDQMQVWAVQDGSIAPYGGDPRKVAPVIRVRGRYRDFALLETPTLGTLTRGSRIATNVYNVLSAARGKDVLFFPARFDAHEIQAADGYAYHVAIQLYHQRYARGSSSSISTDAQGDWWGGAGGGTIAHAAIACFLGDTAETVLAFAATRPPEIPRIALVDYDNDCVGTSLAVMRVMFDRWRALTEAGDHAEARKFKLGGVRADTGGNMRDKSVPPLGDRALDMGVNPRLVFFLRQAIDAAYLDWDLPTTWVDRARDWCHEVKIVVTGGFTPDKIRKFEALEVPVDAYGVGSSLLENSTQTGTSNDFTADVVRVRIDGHWYDMAKVGRGACENPDLEPVPTDE
ncbi:MAG TPA: nicotinate phosphoribosyltransferase [Chloroflexia bacterium]|nr:nicotinate phosphoribosyltransferase [Chloroflexia bacterium]